MKSNNTNHCIASLLLVVSILVGCDGKAKTSEFKLAHHPNVPIGGQTKVSLVVPPTMAATSNLSFEWKAEHGKFPPGTTTEASNLYTAPAGAVTDKISVNILQGNTILDTVFDTIVVSGTNDVSQQATPASEQSGSQPTTQGTNSAAVGASNSVALDSLYFPAGWMGDAQAGRRFVQVNNAWQENPHSAPTCYKWTYSPGEQGWAAVAWQYPENNFGSQPGRNLTGYSKLTVWLRGERGNETLTLKAGGHTPPSARHQATFEAFPVTATLTRDWQQFEIKLSGNLSNIPSAFVWVATRQENPTGPVVFYLDDLRLEK